MGLLDGIRVVECATFITGPYAAMLLGDLGAEVIKVEKPSGDPFRRFQGHAYSPHFQTYNRNKKALTVDMGQPAGRDLVHRLVDTADVFIENFRPGVADRLGIGARQLQKRNPRLVHCEITGFGADGPYSARPAYDTVGQAVGGALSLYMDPSDPRIPGGVFSDGLTGLYACYGILGALLQRQQTGRGATVEVNMLEATMAFLAEPFVNYFITGQVSGPYRRTMVSQSFAFVCQDDLAFIVHLSEPEKFWLGLLRVIDREDLGADIRFKSREDRVRNYWALQDELAAAFRTKSRSEWLERLEKEDVPFAPVNRVDEVVADPQVRHLETVYSAVHPTEGVVRGIQPPVRFDGCRPGEVAAPPVLGEHTDEILRSLDYSVDDLGSLRAAGVI